MTQNFLRSLTLILCLVSFVGANKSFAQCFDAPSGLYPSTTFTPTCSGVAQAITTLAYTGEYSNVNLVAGTTYTFTSSIATDYITISNSAGTEAVAHGLGPVVYTPTVSAVYRYYLHLSSACNSIASGFRNRNISCPAPPPPANNECTNATELFPSPTCVITNGTSAGATQSIPGILCAGFTSATSNDVWFRFTATEVSHIVRVNGGTTLDLVVDVRSGSCDGTNIACADAQVVSGVAEVANLSGLTVGSVYFVRVYGYAGATGAFTICVEGLAPSVEPPVNDACEDAIAINCGGITNGTTANATEDDSPVCDVAGASGGVWYTIEGDGLIFTLTACGSGFDTNISVYRGACDDLACEAGNEGTCAEVEFISEVGTTYFILVKGEGSSTGSFSLEATCVPVCPAPIGEPWTVTAIGGAEGSAIENCDESFSVSATGVGTATADKIHFVHQTLVGDGYVQAEISAFTKFTLGGVQFRDGLTPGARKVALSTQLGSRIVHEVRTVTNGAHTSRQLSAPRNNYVRISRAGDVFTSSVSSDGLNWTQVNTMTVAGLPSALQAGFYVNSQLATEGSVDFNSASVGGGVALVSDFSNRNNEPSGFTAISAFPNPASSELNINMGHLTGEKVQVTVMNSLGQVALQQNFDAVNEVERLDINRLSSGVYFLQVNTELTQKFIVKK